MRPVFSSLVPSAPPLSSVMVLHLVPCVALLTQRHGQSSVTKAARDQVHGKEGVLYIFGPMKSDPVTDNTMGLRCPPKRYIFLHSLECQREGGEELDPEVSCIATFLQECLHVSAGVGGTVQKSVAYQNDKVTGLCPQRGLDLERGVQGRALFHRKRKII